MYTMTLRPGVALDGMSTGSDNCITRVTCDVTGQLRAKSPSFHRAPQHCAILCRRASAMGGDASRPHRRPARPRAVTGLARRGEFVKPGSGLGYD